MKHVWGCGRQGNDGPTGQAIAATQEHFVHVAGSETLRTLCVKGCSLCHLETSNTAPPRAEEPSINRVSFSFQPPPLPHHLPFYPLTPTHPAFRRVRRINCVLKGWRRRERASERINPRFHCYMLSSILVRRRSGGARGGRREWGGGKNKFLRTFSSAFYSFRSLSVYLTPLTSYINMQ